MYIEDEILSIIPAPNGNAWIKTWSDDDKYIYFEQVIAFALICDPKKNQKLITIVLSGDGQPDLAKGAEVVYSETRPEMIDLNKNETEGKKNA